MGGFVWETGLLIAPFDPDDITAMFAPQKFDSDELRYRVRRPRQTFLYALDSGTLTAADMDSIEPEILERIISEECHRWLHFIPREGTE